MKGRFKKIENYHVDIPQEGRRYISPKEADHGTSGPLHLSYADPFEKGLTDVFQAAEELGLGVNSDVNSGNPLAWDWERLACTRVLGQPHQRILKMLHRTSL